MSCCITIPRLTNMYLTGIILPIVLTQPSIDRSEILGARIDYDNYLKAVSGKTLPVRLDIIWNDEYHPICIADFFYRIYRRYKYGRTHDVQTLYLNYNNGRIMSIKSNNFSENDKYTFNNYENIRHETYEYRTSDFETYKENSNIFISTWNHIFSKYDYNKNLSKNHYKLGEDIPVYMNRNFKYNLNE